MITIKKTKLARKRTIAKRKKTADDRAASEWHFEQYRKFFYENESQYFH